MIRSFSLKNFFSYRDEALVSFKVGNTAPRDERFAQSADGGRLAKVMVAFGANASGKTNLLKVLPFATWFLEFSWESGNKNSKIPLKQYKFQKTQNPTSIKLETESTETGRIYRYHMEVTQREVLAESLSVKEPGLRFRNIFQRTMSNGQENYKLGNKVNFSMRDIPHKARRSNASFIATASQFNIDTFDDFLKSAYTIFNVSISGRSSVGIVQKQECYRRMYEDEDFKTWIQEKLRSLDTGISKLNINKIDNDDKDILPVASILSRLKEEFEAIGLETGSSIDKNFYQCASEHVVDGEPYYLSFEEESDGSQELITILHQVYSALDKGGILVYDELEHGIHPNIIPKIFDLFNSTDTNPHNAQLICTCHLADVMHSIHKTQILLTEKNEYSASDVWRLADIEHIRNDDNFVAKYLSGAYGAIPRV